MSAGANSDSKIGEATQPKPLILIRFRKIPIPIPNIILPISNYRNENVDAHVTEPIIKNKAAIRRAFFLPYLSANNPNLDLINLETS